MQKGLWRRRARDDGVGGRGGGRGLGCWVSGGRLEDADSRESSLNVIDAGVPGSVVQGAARACEFSAGLVPRPRAEITESRAVLGGQLLRLRVDEAAARAGCLVSHIFLFISFACFAFSFLGLDPCVTRRPPRLSQVGSWSSDGVPVLSMSLLGCVAALYRRLATAIVRAVRQSKRLDTSRRTRAAGPL